ncbi:MAG: fused MFS/spermidine synthase [Armatimonadetes bacterium]|nr:fused MFS/spermidine synthase [Armatimonadota bacterium]
MLILVFGSTTFAISTVLTAFMAGLALGGWVAARNVDRSRRPVFWYATLELGIGLYALAVPLIFASMTPLYQFVWRQWHPDTYLSALIRFVLAFVILLLPTTLMGATLPVLSKFYAQREGEVGFSVGRLYAINTFGAVVGTFATGFLLLPALGVHHTIHLAAALNVALALTVFAMSRASIGSAHQTPPAEDAGAPPADVSSRGTMSRQVAVSLFCSASSGFIAMVYEVGWSRVLSLILGSSVYAFSIMLTTFLVGLALGGYVFARWADRTKRNGLIMLAALQALVGLTAFVTMHIFQELPYWFTVLFKVSKVAELVEVDPARVELQLLGIRLFLAASVMLLPTFFLGGMFPVVVAICSSDLSRIGKSVGTVYSVNTFGAILGSFIAGFLMIPAPRLGIQNTLVVAAMANLCLAGLVVLFIQQWRLPSRVWVCGLMLLAALNVNFYKPAWNALLMSSGMYHYVTGLKSSDRASFNYYTTGCYDLLMYREGITTTVTVAAQKNGTNIWLATNGKIDASSEPDMPTQVLSGHIPLLLHPNPRHVLVVGLASGVTVGAVQQHPVETETCVEIEPAVREATHFFSYVNHNALDDPRLKLEFNDARNFLLVTDHKYDVIISEPSNPWISGPSNLFTRECFEIGKRSLTPGGFYAQWVQLYGMTPPNLKCLLKTFHSVFPEVLVFQTIEQADLILVGSESRFKIDVRNISRRMQAQKVAADLARVQVFSLGDLLAHFRLGTNELRAYTGKAPINTDDNLLIEFAAPKSLYSNTRQKNERELTRYRRGPLPYLKNLGDTAEEKSRTLTGLGNAFLKAGRVEDAEQLLGEAVRLEGRQPKRSTL